MRRAVLVAASEFKEKESFAPLRFPVRDAERLGELLVDPNLCFFDNVALLPNQSVAAVRRAIEKAARESERGDLLLFYYSGHGQLDSDGTLALAMPESERAYLTSSSLDLEDLKRTFKKSRASQKIMILDCCYGGAAWDDAFKGSIADSMTALAQDIAGTFLLTASTRFQPAFEAEALQGGALTGCLVEAINTGAAATPDSDHITLAQIASYVRQKVPEFGIQQPQCWDLGGIGDLIFSKRPVRLDSAWARRAKRMVSSYCSKGVMDEELGEELRAAINQRDDPALGDRLELINALLRKELGLSAFVRQWDRQAPRPPAAPPPTVEAPAPSPPPPPAPPPPAPPAAIPTPPAPPPGQGESEDPPDAEEPEGPVPPLWEFSPAAMAPPDEEPPYEEPPYEEPPCEESREEWRPSNAPHPAWVIGIIALLAIAAALWISSSGQDADSQPTAAENAQIDTISNVLDDGMNSPVVDEVWLENAVP